MTLRTDRSVFSFCLALLPVLAFGRWSLVSPVPRLTMWSPLDARDTGKGLFKGLSSSSSGHEQEELRMAGRGAGEMAQ